MSDATLAPVADLLARRAGFRLEGSTRARVVRSLHAAAAERGLPVERYMAALEDDAEAFTDLVDRVTVQETGFFRHPEQFEVLRRRILPQLEGPVTIWSAGCANGQEAYTLAMLLDESPHEDWRVIATDLSTAALARTRAASYARRELRGVSDERRARHFKRRGDRFVVRRALRRRVEVAGHNLATDAPPFAAGSCHVVFCRNVLIYFERDAAIRFLDRLHRYLPEGAALFLGASESLWHLSARFQPERIGGAFVYRRREHARVPERPAPPARRAPVVALPAPAAPRAGAPLRAAPRPAIAAARAPALPAVADLLAEGDRAAAARDYARAASAFRKAAYLDADDVRAPLGLGFALEAAGDAAGAQRAFRVARAALRRAGAGAALDGWAAPELARLLDAKLEDRRAAA